MEMPKPGPEHAKLAVFDGTWSGEETMHPSSWDPKGFTAGATLSSRIVCDGFYVAGDYEQRRDGKVSYRGHSVFGWDPNAKEVTLYWFDSMGMGTDVFRGQWQGQVLTLVCKNPMGTHRLSYDFGEKGTLRSKMESMQDGKTWQPMFDGVYHPKK